MSALEQLVQLLARLVADGEITEKQAAAVLAYWQDRDEAELRAVLPLPVEEGAGDFAAWKQLAPLLLERIAPYQERQRRLDAAQDRHAGTVTALAAALEAGRITVAEWQRRVRAANAQLFADALALSGAAHVAAWQRRMREIEREQAAYLQRFADGVSVRRLAAPVEDEDEKKPILLVLSAWALGYLSHRSALYSGAGRGLYYAASESAEAGGSRGAALGSYGWVVRYEAMDDAMTCTPCGSAEGYYLPGRGPMPGDVCLGGGACRCVRVPVFDEALYRQLGGT